MNKISFQKKCMGANDECKENLLFTVKDNFKHYLVDIVPSQTPDIFTNPNLHEHLLFTQPAFKGHFLSLHSTENKNIIKFIK